MAKVLVLAVLAATVLSVASATHEIAAIEAMKRVQEAQHTMFRAHAKVIAASRTLQTQQGAIEIPDLPQCKTQEFATLLAELITSCSTEPQEFMSKTFSTEAAAIAGYTDFCTAKKCAPTLFSKVFGTQYEVCLPGGSTGEYIKFLKLLCMKSSDTQTYCGVTMWHASNFECDFAYSSTTCTAAPRQCAWDSRKSTCSPLLTQANVARVCNDCMTSFVRAVSSTTEDLAAGYAMVCPKVGTTYCAPLFMEMANSFSDSSLVTDALYAGVCADNVKAACLTKLMTAEATQKDIAATKQYASCMRSSGSSEFYQRQCGASLIRTKQSIVSDNRGVAFFCAKNAAGKYCTPLSLAFVNASVQAILSGCSDATRTKIGAALDAMGCCAGSLDELTLDVVIPASELPKTIVTPAPGSPTPAPVLPTASPSVTAGAAASPVDAATSEARTDLRQGSLQQMLAYCPLPGASDRFSRRCKVARAAPVERSLRVPLRWSALNNDPALRERVKKSLVQDISTRIGVSPEDVTGATLVEDPSQQITVSSRGLTTLAAESGAKLNFAISSVRPEGQADAVAQYDNAIKSNDLPLMSTYTVTQAECSSSCFGKGQSASSLNNAGQLNSSSASAIGVFVTLVIAVVAAML